MTGALAACHSGTKLNEGTGTGAGSTAGAQTTGVAPAAVDELNNPGSPLSKRNIYFDFDNYTVKSDYQSLLEAHARYLRGHPTRHVVIQCNTDERGSSEYNLALGEKRSQAVLRGLETLGVPDSQLEARSYGKEKPVAPGHDEAAWAQNRRADLVYR
ncbi:peptidoglycan-associated lipoprotein Pal [Paraburkholderia hospita]|uniref:peptidoglycan-associated lipoprotein Pal n=1 Tax=Paraburkholderia hospita TaxID=169430 RepID=UPI000B341A6D|nr:peptidoglycan-associated lipoprotein Pal [Paraburkholderia hospita]OUL83270.1 peptidoglycan-associated lipoprotein [Paraburkholderia hospita]